LKEYLYIL